MPAGYINKKSQSEKVILNEKSIKQLYDIIHELCRKDSDRIMNGMEIQAIHIEGSKVEILAFCEMKLLNQKISRLKSKTSSALLSSKYTEEFFGRRIWGKGFWYSTILHKENLAISIIKT